MLKSLIRNGAISSGGIVLGAVMAFSVAGLAPIGAMAETTPAPADQAKPAGPDVAPTEWVKICDPKDASLCQISEDYLLVGANSAIASISIQTSPDPKKFAVGIQVPLGFMVNAGIPLNVDGTKKATAQFITCVPSPQSQAYFCLAQALVDDGFIDTLKKAKMLQLSLTGMDKSTATMNFPLTTFAQAYDGPDQAALARQRDDAAKILAEKAKERAKQLEGQQPKP